MQNPTSWLKQKGRIPPPSPLADHNMDKERKTLLWWVALLAFRRMNADRTAQILEAASDGEFSYGGSSIHTFRQELYKIIGITTKPKLAKLKRWVGENMHASEVSHERDTSTQLAHQQAASTSANNRLADLATLEKLLSAAPLLNVPYSALRDELFMEEQKRRQAAWEGRLTIRDHAYQRILEQSLLPRLLHRYYFSADAPPSSLQPYSLTFNGVTTPASWATTDSWMGLSIPLHADSEHCVLLRRPPIRPDVHVSAPYGAKLLDRLLRPKSAQKVLEDRPCYTLLDVAITPRNLNAFFGTDTYYSYQFTFGLLENESVEALIDHKGDIEEIYRDRAEVLNIRGQILPNLDVLSSFKDRQCTGGVNVLFAIARDDDFVIPLQRRSDEVAGSRGMRGVVPQGLHQHMVSESQERMLWLTVYREIFEELFRGEEAETPSNNMAPDWYVDKRHSEQMHWLSTNWKSCTMECVSMGMNLVSGQYEFSILFAIHDTEFYDTYFRTIKLNWEAKEIQEVSSSSEEDISSSLCMPDWTGGGLAAFIEGLQRLKSLDDKRVILPRFSVMGS